MANQSQKKLEKSAESNKKIFYGVLLGVNIFYILFRILWNFSDLTWLTFVEFGFFSLVSKISYSGIKSAVDLGVGYEYYLDFYCINLAVQFLCVFSNYFWLIYLVVPGYVGWYGFKYFLAWANKTGEKEEEEDDPKKKKKEKKQKVKYLKR